MLKWTARTGLDQGIAKTVEWFRSQQPCQPGDSSTCPGGLILISPAIRFV